MRYSWFNRGGGAGGPRNKQNSQENMPLSKILVHVTKNNLCVLEIYIGLYVLGRDSCGLLYYFTSGYLKVNLYELYVYVK